MKRVIDKPFLNRTATQLTVAGIGIYGLQTQQTIRRRRTLYAKLIYTFSYTYKIVQQKYRFGYFTASPQSCSFYHETNVLRTNPPLKLIYTVTATIKGG